MSQIDDRYYLILPNGQSQQLEKMPENRAEAMEILLSVEDPKEGNYVMGVIHHTELHPDNAVNGEVEVDYFKFTFHPDHGFYLKMAFQYHPQNVLISDIEVYAEKIKLCLGDANITSINLRGYSEGNLEYDDEMMVHIDDENDHTIALMFITIDDGVQLKLHDPYQETPENWHCHMSVKSVHSALYAIQVITQYLIKSNQVNLITTSTVENNDYIF